MTTTPDLTTDYQYLDGLETITLTRGSTSVTVLKTQRGHNLAGNQLSGQMAGTTLHWDISGAELTGSLTDVKPHDVITGSDSSKWKVAGVDYLVLSHTWKCIATKLD